MNREQHPQFNFDLRKRRGDEESWEQAAQYEIAYQLARIANVLESIMEALPMAGKGF